MIPTKDLKRISDGCKEHVFSLLTEATNQHNAEKYDLAIFFGNYCFRGNK